jgi:hypothetical protein
MKKLLQEHHAAMAATYKKHADSLDDGHEHKQLFTKLAGHHADLCEALGGASGKAMGGDELVPTRVRATYPSDPDLSHLKLVPRAGGVPLEKAAVSPEHEEMFGGI